MKIKEGASIQGLNIRMRPVLIAADKLWKKFNEELVVTCGLDGNHSAGSLHYYGLAVDLRINYFTENQMRSAANELRVILGNSFDVVLHSTHIHVEYQQ